MATSSCVYSSAQTTGGQIATGDVCCINVTGTPDVLSSISLKLLGATCLHVASKLEDVSYLGVRDLALLMVDVGTDGPCALSDLLRLEVYLLNQSDFNLYLATTIDFLHIYFECVADLRDSPTVQYLSKYLGELTLLFPDQFAGEHLPSLIATAIVCFSMTYSGIKYDKRLLEYLSKQRLCDSCACVESLYMAHSLVEKKHRNSAVYRRYDTLMLLNVSALPSMPLTTFNSMLAELKKPP